MVRMTSAAPRASKYLKVGFFFRSLLLDLAEMCALMIPALAIKPMPKACAADSSMVFDCATGAGVVLAAMEAISCVFVGGANLDEVDAL